MFVSSVFLSGFSFSASPSSTAILDFSSLENFSQPIDVSEQFNEKGVFGLGSGTLTFRVKPSGGFSTLLGVSDPNSNVRYIAFYVNSRNGNEQYGVELRTDNHTRLIPNSELVTPPIPSSDEFKTITYAFDKANQTIKIYVNGELKKATNQSKFLRILMG
ncbi:Sialidase, N-terminal domain [Rodentibacter pneumotropicus]|uniref:Sialidase, N-terminal domain n=1 Tax=Rodentibacter pneumotropicus TaxID=758 RepID=A0A448MID4_9PAST|nr:Sialidase, N-terminal domain [Rodentibacter pneumotropicus]